LRLPFVVDSSISRLAVSVRGEGSMGVGLLDPEGGVLDLPRTRPGRADYRVHDLPIGTWQIDVTSAADEVLDVEVQCESSLSVRVRTKRPGGRPGHMGWFPLVGRPTFGKQYLLEVEPRQAKESPVAQLTVGLVSPTGDVRWLDTSSTSSRIAGWAALATFRPGERVVVLGKFASGERFSRMATAPHPSAFEIEPVWPGGDHLLDEVLVPTRERALRLRVQRTGSSGPASFRVQGVGLHGRLEPGAVELVDGQPTEVVLYARASANAPARSATASLTLSVGGQPNDPEGNAFVLTTRVGKDGDGDGFSDEAELVGKAEHDGDGDGVPDFTQREVATFSELLSSFSVRFQPDAVLESFDRVPLLGESLPAGVREAPYGAWRLGIDAQAKSVPQVLRVHLGRAGMQRVDRLLVLDASNAWQVRAPFDTRRRSFELQLDAAEQERLRSGQLTIAVAH
jgi:hypothetical protein